jgi:hypothetical protein
MKPFAATLQKNNIPLTSYFFLAPRIAYDEVVAASEG